MRDHRETAGWCAIFLVLSVASAIIGYGGYAASVAGEVVAKVLMVVFGILCITAARME